MRGKKHEPDGNQIMLNLTPCLLYTKSCQNSIYAHKFSPSYTWVGLCSRSAVPHSYSFWKYCTRSRRIRNGSVLHMFRKQVMRSTYDDEQKQMLHLTAYQQCANFKLKCKQVLESFQNSYPTHFYWILYFVIFCIIIFILLIFLGSLIF